MSVAVPTAVTPTPPLAQRTLGDIAVHIPGSTAVFRRFKLDFCCGGGISLAAAVEQKRLSLSTIERELEALSPQREDSLSRSPSILIDHILTRYHEVHRRELPELIRLARRVEAVHREHPAVPAGLALALTELEAELESHMQKEEQILFPLLLRGTSFLTTQPIAMMRFEHEEHGERLRALELLAHGTQAPAEACPTWKALYAGVRKLIDDLMEHIHLENNVLFPQFAPASA